MTGFTIRVDLLGADEAMVDQIQVDVREQDLEQLALTGKEARDVSGLAIAKIRVVVLPHRR